MGGGGGGSAGGGSSSGSIEYPDFLKDLHKAIMQGSGFQIGAGIRAPSVLYATREAYYDNPFDSVLSYDPEPRLLESDDRLDEYTVLVHSLNPEELWKKYKKFAILNDLNADGRPNFNWESYVDRAVAVADSIVLTDQQITDRADEYRQRLTTSYAINKARFNHQMADVNAVMSSAFVVGNSNLLIDLERQVGEFTKELILENWKRRIDYIVQAVAQMFAIESYDYDRLNLVVNGFIQLLDLKMRYESDSTHLEADVNKVAIIAGKEEIDRQIGLGEAEARWKMEIWQYPSNSLSSIGGGTALYNSGGQAGGGSNLAGSIGSLASLASAGVGLAGLV